MSGLFEDETNVRNIKKPASPKEPAVKPKKKSVADKLASKAESKKSIVNLAGSLGGGAQSFDEVNIAKVKKADRLAQKDDEKIVPPINYVSDDHDQV